MWLKLVRVLYLAETKIKLDYFLIFQITNFVK